MESNKWAGWILFGFKSLCSASSSALRCQNCLKSLALLLPHCYTDIIEPGRLSQTIWRSFFLSKNFFEIYILTQTFSLTFSILKLLFLCVCFRCFLKDQGSHTATCLKKINKSYTIHRVGNIKVTASFPPLFYFHLWNRFDLVSLKAENFDKGGRTI